MRLSLAMLIANIEKHKDEGKEIDWATCARKLMIEKDASLLQTSNKEVETSWGEWIRGQLGKIGLPELDLSSLGMGGTALRKARGTD